MDGPAWNMTTIPLHMLQKSSNQLPEQQLLSRKCNVCVLKLRILHQKMGSQIVVSENRKTYRSFKKNVRPKGEEVIKKA